MIIEAAAQTKTHDRRGRIYSKGELAVLVGRYAALAAAIEGGLDRRRGAMLEAQLADVEEALARLPKPLYEAVTLRGLLRLTNTEAAKRLGVHPNTTSRRYMRAVRWLTDYLNGPRSVEPIRELAWREWARKDVDRARMALEDGQAPGPGRPIVISRTVDETVLRLHCAGSTERNIVQELNRKHPREGGREWTRASVRSVLKRYRVPKRPRGRRRTPARYYLGDFTKSDYREIEFGEHFCDPEALLLLRSPSD
jgi:Sigma-70, region 4